MRIKKIISALSVLVLAVSTLSTTAFAEVEVDEGYDYDRFRGKNVTLQVYNWGEYISDGSDGSLDVIGEFEKLTGIDVEYSTFPSNEDMYSVLKSGRSQYDIIIPSDYMIGKLIEEDMLEKIDFDNVPNFTKYCDKKFLNPEYDPTNEYSAPYTWGTVCILYDATRIDEEITSWDALWNEKYSGQILMFNNPRDAMAIALIRLGYSLNTTDEKELKEAADLLIEQKPLVQAYVMDEVYDKMGNSNAFIAPYYVGDSYWIMETNPDLAVCIPEEGTNLFADAMCIPKNPNLDSNNDEKRKEAQIKKEAAEMFINYMYETQVALENIEYICYSTPHTGAYALLDEEVRNDPFLYPSDEFITEKTEAYVNLPQETNRYMDQLWTEIKISGDQNKWAFPILLFVCLAVSILTIVRRFIKKKKDNM
ncbi:MAG: spermidine/putrescine ABC transporter substrate-binding protein [Ruminococcus sp.]|nr:spermidine/putrescine ABC transporter substrate-binding protein [Ruminococcus sp.]